MPEGGGSLPEVASKELSRKLLEGEAKLEQGSFEEAEVTLREALSINNEVRPLYEMHSDFLASRIFGNASTVLGEIVSINPNSHGGAMYTQSPSLGHHHDLEIGEHCRRLEPYLEELSIERVISKELYGF